ncbi:MAG: LysR family transcriptional regulator [Xanthomonadales bacterium]|nr:LysR family transcriptional regulator [Xanthomonadales bacterium]NIN60237.1 LysR family transcriptional regulator [Xanthomonadales bacterium]NIN75595.1 LysR family transcriptional regulator [Xanthomonadales bacterium]NIO14274.1 LysR family transcriptional regulator [Xanthomonadales bacterium]NIP12630.1 LysR family transcriptional regulator [Xanthomonadales bacterium]
MQESRRYYYKGNPLKQLRAFCAVARNGKMSAAADELYLSQSAISLQVKALEQELETVLFERRGPHIQLTPEGRRLLEMAQPLVEGMDSLNQRFRTEVTGDPGSGEVVIAAGESTIIYILPELVARFRERYPKIHVQLRNVTGRDGLAMIRDDQVDFAVGSMLDVPADIRYTALYSFDPALILPLGHELADKPDIQLEDIAPFGLILPPRRLTTWRMVDRVFQQQRIPYNVVLEVGGWEVIKRYVELGFGISIVTSICLREGDRLVARNMSRFFPRRTYGIVRRRGRHLPPAARAFLQEIQETPLSRADAQAGHSSR